MDLRAELPFSTLLWQPRATTWLVTVVCKATFLTTPGELKLASHHEPLVEQDAYWDDDPNRSLCAATDLVPSKPKCDVVIVGHAFAPPGKPVRALIARLAFESIDKSVELVSDRSVGPDGTVYQGPRFSRMPLVYERAAGGPGTWNPVGIPARSPNAYAAAALPNVTPVGKGDDTINLPDPIGFGPIAIGWPRRAEKASYKRAQFDPKAWSKEPLPEGFDLSFFNVAPPDQQVDAIPEGAPLLLEGLHAQHPKLATKLPGIRPVVTVDRRGHQEKPKMRPDTLWIDTDRGLVMLTWRGHFALEHPSEAYRVGVEAEGPRQSWRTAPHAVGTLPRETLLDALSQEQTLGDLPPLTARDPLAVAATAPAADRRAAPEGARTPQAGGLPFKQTGEFAHSAASALPFGYPTTNVPGTVPPPPPAAAPATYPPPPMPASATSSAQPLPPPAPAPVVMHAGAAALGGLVSASNAAADPRSGQQVGRPARARIEGDVLHLLWFNPDAAPRVRRKPEWKKILDELEQGAFDPEIDEPALAEDPAEMEDRREIYEVLARATPSGQDGLDRALLDAVRADGRFAAQLLVLLGEVRFDFDEIELLKATVSAATPFAGSDEELKKTLAGATSFLSTPGLVAAPDVATSMIGKVRDAFGSVSRPVPASYLDDQTERALLERRAYQKRSVFGEPHLRSLFFFTGGSGGIPTYFPEAVARKLPLFRRLRVRLLVEANFQADQYETHAVALKVGAVARVVR